MIRVLIVCANTQRSGSIKHHKHIANSKPSANQLFAPIVPAKLWKLLFLALILPIVHTTSGAPLPTPNFDVTSSLNSLNQSLIPINKNVAHMLDDEEIKDHGPWYPTCIFLHEAARRCPPNQLTPQQTSHLNRSLHSGVSLGTFCHAKPTQTHAWTPDNVTHDTLTGSMQVCSWAKRQEGQLISTMCFMENRGNASSGVEERNTTVEHHGSMVTVQNQLIDTPLFCTATASDCRSSTA